MDQKKMKSKRYSAIEAAAKIIEMESDDSDYDVQDDKSEVSWSENVTEDTVILIEILILIDILINSIENQTLSF